MTTGGKSNNLKPNAGLNDEAVPLPSGWACSMLSKEAPAEPFKA
jgi:hypothetical protein